MAKKSDFNNEVAVRRGLTGTSEQKQKQDKVLH